MERNFQYQQVNISYAVFGEGVPVVLLHGFGEDSSIWKDQVSFLQTHCQLIVPDLPGSGKSGMIEGDTISMDDYADCINAMLENEKVNSCILLGHSMGGYITLAFVEKYATKVKGFGFIHSTAFADPEEKKASRKQGINMINEHGAFAFLKNTIPNLFSKESKGKIDDKIQSLIEKAGSFTNEALVQYYSAMMNRPDRSALLKESKVPVLFIIGTEDAAVPIADVMQQVHLPSISHIHILEGVGHMSMLEAPGELNNFLLNFVNSFEAYQQNFKD